MKLPWGIIETVLAIRWFAFQQREANIPCQKRSSRGLSQISYLSLKANSKLQARVQVHSCLNPPTASV